MKQIYLGLATLATLALAVTAPSPAAKAASSLSLATTPSAVATSARTALTSTASATCSYTIQSGDWLSHIAPRFGMTWNTLYAMNRHTIGANPNLIMPGELLVTCASSQPQPVKDVDLPTPAHKVVAPAHHATTPVHHAAAAVHHAAPVQHAVAPVHHVAAPVQHPVAQPAPSYSTGSVQAMIQQVFGPNAGQALTIARCESGFNPTAYNPTPVFYNGHYLGHAMGVFQIVPATFASTSFAGQNVYNAATNIQAAHEIFVRDGYSWREWQCRA